MGFEASLCQLVEIVLPVPLAQVFSYRFGPKPEAEGEKVPRIQVGDLVVVPFGRRLLPDWLTLRVIRAQFGL